MLGEVFDPKAEYSIQETCRPHWSQSGAVVFVTFRTADSIPKQTIDIWNRQKIDWLARRGYGGKRWSTLVKSLTPNLRKEFYREFNRKREDCLDQLAGACVLRNSKLSKIVADSLMHFDQARYRMGDFVVMPNHVHLLCVFKDEEMMRRQFDSWQTFTATKINRQIGSKGKFWQGDPFDHLVRSPEQYEYLRDYIGKNPFKADLIEGEYFYHRYDD